MSTFIAKFAVSMTVLDHVAHLNNTGVSHLQKDDPILAIRAFRQALTLMHELAMPGSVILQSPVHEAAMIASCRRLCIRQSTLEISQLQRGRFHVYARLFRIEPLPERLGRHDQCVTQETRHSFYAFINVLDAHILFNYALAWHHHAMKAESVKASLHSGHLYEMVLNATIIHENNWHNHTAYASLCCLVLNNLATLHYNLFQYKESKVCFHIVHILLHDLHGLESYLQRDELAGLLWNTYNHHPPALASAA
jgi:hypothetical protein